MYKKSVVVLPGYLMMCFVIIGSFLSFVEAKIGIHSAMYIMPIIYIIGLVVLATVNNLLKKPLDQASEQVKEISEGNLDIDIKHSKSKDELGVLNNALLGLKDNLINIIGDITLGSDSIVNASQQISSSSEQLAQGANEQASSIEEVSSTMEQITANIVQNADNSQLANKAMDNVNINVGDVNAQSESAIKSNKLIVDTIAIVSEIANETKILALNAAVEAARAGSHGKGFAVVASAVKGLADKSKDAADNINKLSRSSLEVAEQTGELMKSTTPIINSTSKLISEITAASAEQSTGSSQVNNAMQQLNVVTQENAASSEELAISAEQLTEQAEQLRKSIEYFTL
jgi:methyl-accepting chemotaxis protein